MVYMCAFGFHLEVHICDPSSLSLIYVFKEHTSCIYISYIFLGFLSDVLTQTTCNKTTEEPNKRKKIHRLSLQRDEQTGASQLTAYSEWMVMKAH